MNAVDVVAARLRGQARYCTGSSPFYAVLLEHLAVDVEAGGPTIDLLGGTAEDPPGFVPQLRLLGAVHRLALRGDAPELAVRYPSCGGDGDADAAWPAVRAVLADRADELRPWLARPPQTNEVGRAASLIGGLLTVAAETGLPLRLLEIGASGGLNLRLDHFWYQAGPRGVGDPRSPVRFVECWEDGTPPFDVPFVVTERAGCDQTPVDATSEAGRLTLLAYVWPDQAARLELLRAALDVAARVPARVERANFLAWLPAQLGTLPTGMATVVFHSVVLPYCTADDIAALAGIFAAAGARATPDAPLAWLRLEPSSATALDTELRLTSWPGGRDRLLARAPFHLGPVRWLADGSGPE